MAQRLLRAQGMALAAALVLTPAAAQAQLEVAIQPRVLWIVPITAVYEVNRALGSDSDPWRREVSASDIPQSPAVSIAIELGDRDAGWILRSGIARSFQSTTVVRGILDPPTVGTPLGLGFQRPGEDFSFEPPTSLTIGFAEVALPLLMGTRSVRPYVSAGATVKHYQFGSFDVGRCEASGVACGSMDFAKPRSGNVVGAQFGVGIYVEAWGRSLDIGLVDTLNDYNGRTMHDLGAFVGVVLPLWSGSPQLEAR